MKFTVTKEHLLPVLQAVASAVARSPVMPATANILLSVTTVQGGVTEESLSLTATDLEVQLSARTTVQGGVAGTVTVPGKKMLDIVKAIPAQAAISLSFDGTKALIRSGKSRFTLSTLPAEDFPLMRGNETSRSFDMPKPTLLRLVEKTQFSMANGDVRYYLNGLLLEIAGDAVKAVASDGHRLSMCGHGDLGQASQERMILPRKAVAKLGKLLSGDGSAKVTFGESCLVAEVDGVVFTCKLIDGKYPEYQGLIPMEMTNVAKVDKGDFLGALQRIAVVANESSSRVNLIVRSGSIIVSGDNATESGEEEVDATYDGPELEIGFNVHYLHQAVSAVDAPSVGLCLYGAQYPCLIDAPEGGARYVVMPMRM